MILLKLLDYILIIGISILFILALIYVIYKKKSSCGKICDGCPLAKKCTKVKE